MRPPLSNETVLASQSFSWDEYSLKEKSFREKYAKDAKEISRRIQLFSSDMAPSIGVC